MVDLSKIVLITGPSGLIGKNTAQSLKQKFTQHIPSDKELVILSQSKVHKFFLRNEIDSVIHCAKFGATRKTLKTGEVIFNLAENQDHFKRWINLGSEALESYGNNPRTLEHLYAFKEKELSKKAMLI
jgi:hypothetical protein